MIVIQIISGGRRGISTGRGAWVGRYVHIGRWIIFLRRERHP